MKKLLIFLIAGVLFAANLINVNFFESKNKIDILLSLDSKFAGKVKQISKHRYLITDITSDKVVQKEFQKSFVNSIIISPQNNAVKIEIMTNAKIVTNVALTPDGYGVRFRIINAAPVKSANTTNIQKLEPKMQGFDTFSYIVGVLILIILAFVLWFIKKRAPSLPVAKEDMRVLIQKPIDAKNKVVLFQYGDRKYLMLVGNTNVLLDVFANDTAVPKNEVEFDEMLKLSKKYDNIEKYIQNAEKLKEFDEKI